VERLYAQPAVQYPQMSELRVNSVKLLNDTRVSG